MEEDIEKLVNAWFTDWVKFHDPFEDDFEDEIYRVIPNHKFTYDTFTSVWIRL